MYSATIKVKKVTKEDIEAACEFPFVIINERNNKLLVEICLDTKEQVQALESAFIGKEFKYVGIWKEDGCKYGYKRLEVGGIVDDINEQDSLKDITLDETEYLDIVPDIIIDEVAQRPTVATQVHGFFGWENKII